MDIIAVDNSARAAAKEAQELVDGMRDNMHEFLLYGVPRKELEKVLNRVFEEADPENLGQLNRNVCCCSCPIVPTLHPIYIAAVLNSAPMRVGLQAVPPNQRTQPDTQGRQPADV